MNRNESADKAFKAGDGAGAGARGVRSNRARKLISRAALGLAVFVAVVAVAFFAYTANYYHAEQTFSQFAGQEAEGVAVPLMAEDCDGYYVVAPAEGKASFGLVLYPGAKVDPVAYTPLARDLAEHGVYCIIAKMPFNLAFFNIDAASELMQAAPQVEHWWVGGHSLGGAMASMWAAGHAGDIEGIALLGAYASSDLSDTDLDALVIYGSEDGVLNRDKLVQNAPLLPQYARELVIEGGNHAGFGVYGPQAGDGDATISPEAQQEETAEAIAQAMGV